MGQSQTIFRVNQFGRILVRPVDIGQPGTFYLMEAEEGGMIEAFELLDSDPPGKIALWLDDLAIL